MEGELFIIAWGVARPDTNFGSIDSVARELHRRRQALPGQPGLRLTTADVWRAGQHSGAAVAVRLRDGAELGHGTFLAYVFMPRTERPCRRLAEALSRLTGGQFEGVERQTAAA